MVQRREWSVSWGRVQAGADDRLARDSGIRFFLLGTLEVQNQRTEKNAKEEGREGQRKKELREKRKGRVCSSVHA